jgi:hypothetical protein
VAELPAVASAIPMFPRSIAVAKIRRGCPCAVTALAVGPDGCYTLIVSVDYGSRSAGGWLPRKRTALGRGGLVVQ